MLRPIFSYVLTSLILLSQVGLPMHFHYCKGALESVSVLFKQECNDDQVAMAKMPSCCQKFLKKHCEQNKDCCHDQVKVISQDLTSVLPGLVHWTPIISELNNPLIQTPGIVSLTISPFSLHSNGTDSGPPIYIRFHSLIYYA
jgi:hypothetical protein